MKLGHGTQKTFKEVVGDDLGRDQMLQAFAFNAREGDEE